MSTLLLVCEDPDRHPLNHNPRWAELLVRITRGSAVTPQVLACDWHSARDTLNTLYQRRTAPAWVVLQTRQADPAQWHVLDEMLQPLPVRPAPGLRGTPAVTVRSYSGGRARTPGQAAKPAPELQRVMENLPALHWVSAGQTGRSPQTPKTPKTPMAGQTSRAAAGQWHPDLLSPRRREVFGLMVDLFHYKEIARQLGISAETVKDHARAILAACGCRDRVELVSRWAEWLRQQQRKP